jgi:membrane-bound metal-dependent hydrolase YbcI (DUF457 family)
MFIGHYSAALALKRVETNASLGLLFIAVQFVDILFFPLVLLGVERLNIIENFTQSTHFELEFMPYTHSLAASAVWALAAYLLWRLVPSKPGVSQNRVAIVFALAVFSHWILDLLVHTPDLPLLGDSSPKLGLGLWNDALITFTLEAALLIAAVLFYLRGTKHTSTTGKYGVVAFAVVLIAANAFSIFGPPPENLAFLAAMSMGSYFAFAVIALWLDRKRRPILSEITA